MDEEDARDFNERCGQCSEVNWGVTDGGGFYCRSCHNITERTREVVNTDFITNSRVQTISKGSRQQEKNDGGCEWYICEGFQLVLRKQVEALEALGVCPQMKDEILGNFWRCYLQKSEQAYCKRPARETVKALSVCESSTDVDSDPERSSLLHLLSLSESEGDLQTDCSFASSVSKVSEIEDFLLQPPPKEIKVEQDLEIHWETQEEVLFYSKLPPVWSGKKIAVVSPKLDVHKHSSFEEEALI